MKLDKWLEKWLLLSGKRLPISPLKDKGTFFNIFPHLENLCSKGEKVLYQDEFGWKEEYVYNYFGNLEDSPADVLLNWVLDVEKTQLTETQVMVFTVLFGEVGVREAVFKDGVPLYYFASILANFSYDSLNELSYHEKFDTCHITQPFFYYDPFPIDYSTGVGNQAGIEGTRPIKTMKIFTRDFMKKFNNDLKFRDDLLVEHPIISNSENYKGSFENSGLFSTHYIRKMYKLIEKFRSNDFYV
jgi:hypothetical protein